MMAIKKTTSSQTHDNIRQFVVFQVGQESYGVPILSVREIRPWQEPTLLPDAPSDVHGMIDLRGIVVPIYDFRHHLCGQKADIIPSTVVMITQVQGRFIGMYVDVVNDIMTIPAHNIKPTPKVEGYKRDHNIIIGVVTLEHSMITLIDLDHFFDLDTLPA